MLAAAAPLAFVPAGALAQPAPPGHHDPKGKPPSKFTLDVLERSRATLRFGDTRDFDEQKKGFIAPMKDLKIRADAGHVAWDMERYQFLLQKDRYDSIHPSLMRISTLNMNYGLYEVIPGIYQVRGFDLADISLVRGKTGCIVIDPLTAAETARAAVKLFQEHVGKGLPITAVIYSHSHGDHWGGVRGVKDVEFDHVDVTLGRFVETLDANFEGQEVLRQRLVHKTHKYGNDDDYADALMTRTFRMLFDASDGRPNTKGGAYRLEMLPTTCHVYFGEVCLASADGRNEGQPLSEGISPVQGADRHGPTAVIKSAGRWIT